MFKATSSRHGRHRLEPTVLGRTRKGRIARIVSATAVAGVLAGGITLAAAPANASTTTIVTYGGSCALPAGATWKLEYVTQRKIANHGVGPLLYGYFASAKTATGTIGYQGETHSSTPPAATANNCEISITTN